MRRVVAFYLSGLSFIFILSGCVVRTYPVTKDRIDQDLTEGNRGYLKGEVPAGEVKERKKTRTTQVVEIELHSPVRFEKTSKEKPTSEAAEKKITEDENLWGNRGFISQGFAPQAKESPSQLTTYAAEKYTVQKGDTLQKIAKKFYGTTKKWTKIYEANKAALKGPDKIYPGQVIDIPYE